MTSSTSQIADYFVVVGLPDHPQNFQEFSGPESPTKRSVVSLDPITDIAVIFRQLGDPVPRGFECIEKTPAGFSANLNFGSFRAPEVLLCYRRGRDRPPLTDMGVMYEGARLLENAAAVFQTPTGRIANVNNVSGPCLYITYSRAPPNATLEMLVVMDICVVIASKGEEPPHTFCKIEQKLNTGLVGADVYLCYRKARLRDHALSFKPEVLSRYPIDDTAAPYPLNCNIPMFCLPLGASLEVWPVSARDPQPVFSSFVITHTQNDASESSEDKFIQYYGCVVTFFESCTLEQLSPLQINRLGLSPDVPLSVQNKRIASTKAICLLSQYAFFSEFKQYLTHVYKMSFTKNHRLPIERYISHLLHEVPVPSADRPRILAQLSPEESILFTRPEDLPLPPSCASFTNLLNDLGVEKTLDVFLYAILGQSMLVHSVRPSVLTLACEAVKTMIFPFIWSFPFIPFCPLALSEIVQCPMGFIIGVDTSYFDLYEPPPEVICIDLDTGNILLPEDKKHLTSKLLPKKPAAQLQARLDRVYKTLQRTSTLFSEVVDVTNDISHEKQEIRKQRETALELECREAFLFFMATILRGYHAFLIVPTNVKTKTNLDVDSLFRIKDFVRTRDKSLAKFFELLNLGGLQNFAKFVEELTFSSKPQVFDFFTDCCRKVDEIMNATGSGSARTRLIETSRDFDNERTVVIPPPSSQGLEEGRVYSYTHFSILDPTLFHDRPVILVPQAKAVTNGASISSKDSEKSDHQQQVLTLTTSSRSGRQTFDWGIIKRTRQEIKSSGTLLLQKSSIPYEWAKIVEAQCYSVWFCVLPAFCRLVHTRRKLLSYAVTTARNWARYSDALGNDQTPYRIIFAMADLYRHPAVAVQLLMRIRKTNFEPNAATLALCNKVLYQTSWQTESQSRPARLWRLMRDLVCAVSQFKAAGVRHRSRSHQSLVSQSATSSDQPYLITQNSGGFNGANNGRGELLSGNSNNLGGGSGNKVEEASFIYSPRQKTGPPGFGKFPAPETPLISTNSGGFSAAPRTPRLPSFPAECVESQNSLNFDTQISSHSYTSPYIREKMGKFIDFLTTKPVDFLQKTANSSAGRRLVESQSSTQVMEQNGSAVMSPPTPQPPVSINILSPGSDSSEFDQQQSHRHASDSGSGGLFKRILSRTVTGVLDSPSPGRDYGSSSAMKESRSTPQFLLSSASSQLSSGFRQMGSKLRSAVAQIAAATTVVPDDTLIDLHTELSSQPMASTNLTTTTTQVGIGHRQASASSLSVDSISLQAAQFGSGMKNSQQPQADVVSIGSQVTSDSATNDSSNVRAGQNLANFQQNSISSSTASKSAQKSAQLQASFLDEPNPDQLNATGSLPEDSDAGGENVLDDLDFWPLQASREDCLVQVVLCAANKCPSIKCGQILFEEDIMAMWSASDSVFNAVCPMCGFRFIPKLEIYVKDFRNNQNSGSEQDPLPPRLKRCNSEILTKWSSSELGRLEAGDIESFDFDRRRPSTRLIGPISCIFLSPLALRKEIEQATERNNASTTLFADGSFVDNHDTLYWNLLFVNARMQFHSHLPSLIMFSRLIEQQTDPQHKRPSVVELREAAVMVNVQVVWDNLALYSVSGRPLYWHWATGFGRDFPAVDALVDFRPFSRRLMSKLLTSVRRSDMLNAIKLVLLIRRRGLQNEIFFRNLSMYRLLLNLCIVALGRNNIDIKAFDKSYYTIFNQIKATAATNTAALIAQGRLPLSMEMRPWDQPPSEAAIFCRRAHLQADVCHDFDQRPVFLVPPKTLVPMSNGRSKAAAANNFEDGTPDSNSVANHQSTNA